MLHLTPPSPPTAASWPCCWAPAWAAFSTARPPAASMAGPPSVAAPTAMPAATPRSRDLIPVLNYLLSVAAAAAAPQPPPVTYGPELLRPHVLLLLLRYDISLQMLQALLLACVTGLRLCQFGGIYPRPLHPLGIFSASPFSSLLPPTPRVKLLSAALGASPSAAACCWWCCSTKKLRRVDAMGGGDLKLLFLTGLYLGWLEDLLCLLLACLIGIITALAAQSAAVSKPPPHPWGPPSPPPPFSPCSLAMPSPPPTSPSSGRHPLGSPFGRAVT